MIATLTNKITATLGGGNHGHPSRYLQMTGGEEAFVNPSNPGMYPANVPGNAAAGVQQDRAEAECKETIREYKTFQGMV